MVPRNTTSGSKKVNKTYSILGLIKRNFEYIGKDEVFLLYKSTVRSHLEFLILMWSPYKVGLTETTEKVQKRGTKLASCCKSLPYSKRLQILNTGIPTLKYRRHRGDMIEIFKILHGIYDTAV